jgi:dihydroorotase
VTIIDPNRAWTVDSSRFESHSRNTPFDGWELPGRASQTIVNGTLVWSLSDSI